MFSLHLRFMMLLGILGAIVFWLVTFVGQKLGMTSFYFQVISAFGIMVFQYLMGPFFVEMMSQIKYVSKNDSPKLFNMVEDLARKANIPMPKVGISAMGIPNAFAFGRSLRDGRVCVTQGLLNLLNDDELKAVLGHEICHLKNKDVFFMSILSVIPLLISIISRILFWSGMSRRRDREDSGGSGNIVLIQIGLMIAGFVTSLLLMYGSRIREYFADKGSVDLGNKPASLASALYKLVYGSARMDQEELKTVEGMKAFFANDPSRAIQEFRELKVLDSNRDGDISSAELITLRNKQVKLGVAAKIGELIQTHPNMLKRIKQLSKYNN